MKRCLVMLVVMLAVVVTAQANLVPNGDFQTIVKPGTTMPATIEDGAYFNIPSQTMQGGGIATYADGGSGPGIELPGWIIESEKTNADVMQGGTWGGPDGSGDMALLCFAGWGGPTSVQSAAPLSLPALGAGEVYALSADVYNHGGPVVLELLVNGVVQTPDTASTPDMIQNEWVEFTRTYSSIDAGDVTITVGTRDDAGDGWTGNRASIDNVDLSVSVVPEPATMILLGLGGLSLIRRRKA